MLLARLCSCIYYALLWCSFLEIALFAADFTFHLPLVLNTTNDDEPRHVDGAPGGAFFYPGQSLWLSALVNLILLCVFTFQHSLMSRVPFQALIKQRLNHSMERLLHLIASCTVVHALIVCWQPMPAVVFSLSPSSLPYLVLRAASIVSFLFLLASLVTVTWYDLFNYRAALCGEKYPGIPQVVPFVYRCTRAPIFSALLGVFWSTPHMVRPTHSHPPPPELSVYLTRRFTPSPVTFVMCCRRVGGCCSRR